MTDKSAESFRNTLVDSLIQSNQIRTPDVEHAFRTVPRHLFLPEFSVEDAYSDRAISLKEDSEGMVTSSASQPTMMAIMLEQLQLKPAQNVLEIGTATGYNAALMQEIVGKSGSVTSMEIDPGMARVARRQLRNAGYIQVHVVEGNGMNGYPPRASYDRIIATAGAREIPVNWIRQLKPDGRLITPMWLDGVQICSAFTKQADGTLYSTDNHPCAFVYLTGAGAGPPMHQNIGSTSLIILSDELDKIDPTALHLLLSDDHELSTLGQSLEPSDFWFGFQIYLMLNEPRDAIFAIYRLADGQKAYGIDHQGFALFTPASAAFVSYQDRGTVHSFAGSDAYLIMRDIYDQWRSENKPDVTQLRVRIIPRYLDKPDITNGRLYTRNECYVHAWLEE